MKEAGNLSPNSFSDSIISEPEVVFARSEVTVKWCPSYDNLLVCAEAQGLRPSYCCREGACATCECQLLQGRVEYIEEPLFMTTEDRVLLCCAKPITDVVIDI